VDYFLHLLEVAAAKASVSCLKALIPATRVPLYEFFFQGQQLAPLSKP
jgi:hypothetical protein